MFQHQGIWFPDGEKHFPDWMTRNGELVEGRGTYQIKKFRAVMKFVARWRRAVDVGGHVGLWSMQIAKRFERLDAFEPVPQFRECWLLNMKGLVACGLALHHCALGDEAGFVAMSIDPADTGGTHVHKHLTSGLSSKNDAPLATLDSHEWQDVDFIKIDCEGYEHHVLVGAEQTIRATWPTIIVEQKPHKLFPNFGIKGAPAVELLKEWGYKVAAEMSGDYIMVKP